MNKIKKEFLGKRVLGAPESAMRVLSMWLMKKSRKVVPVMVSMKDECVSLPKPQSHLAQLHDDDEDVFATSLIDRCGTRPVSLQNMCLAMFAVTYVIQSATQKEDTDSGNDEEEEMQNTKKDNSLTMMKLQKRIGCHQEEKTRSNITYKKIQNSYRTRKILPCKATALLFMA